MAEIKLIPGGQQDQIPVSAQSLLKNPWVFFQEYRQDTEPGGTITYYNVFSGVILFQNRIHTDSCEEIREKANALAINFCANGRFESQFSENDLGIVEPGDVAVSLYDGEHGTHSISRFPLGFYDGLSLYVDCDLAMKWLAKNFPCLSINLTHLKDQLLKDHWYWVGPAGTRCEHVFRELFECVSYADKAYIQLKVAELFLLLPLVRSQERTEQYYPMQQVQLVRHLRDLLISDTTSRTTIEDLAQAHHISVTRFQKIFKKLYGTSIYQYVKQYRLEQATIELTNSARSITDIALDAGFSSASKFGESFKKRYGITPTEYRLQFRDRNGIIELNQNI